MLTSWLLEAGPNCTVPCGLTMSQVSVPSMCWQVASDLVACVWAEELQSLASSGLRGPHCGMHSKAPLV